MPHEWQPIETVPDKRVLFCNESGYVMSGYASAGRCYVDADEDPADDLTHWMPLPEPPK
jgi:hypothetical protein